MLDNYLSKEMDMEIQNSNCWNCKDNSGCMMCEDQYRDETCSCGSGLHAVEQHDYYGIYCGKMCDVCFESKYKQDAYYDYSNAGEYLDEDY